MHCGAEVTESSTNKQHHLSPASALRRHEVGGAAPASPPPAPQGHCRGLHSWSGDECARGASRQRQGPRSVLEAIRPTSANDVFETALWETFVSTTLGLGIPVLSSLPRLHNRPITKCGCCKTPLDVYGDHTASCTAHSGATKAHDWMVGA